MVVLLDLDVDHDGDDEDSVSRLRIALHPQWQGFKQVKISDSALRPISQQSNQSSLSRAPNTVNAGLLAAALACYPIALSLASRLDLNDLFALSSTCHAVRSCLIQFAHHLRVESLRCINDPRQLTSFDLDDTEETTIFDKRSEQEQGYEIDGVEEFLPNLVSTAPLPGSYHGVGSSDLGLTGRVSKCARDLVAPCRKCGVVVCRNCAIKPPMARCLSDRFRRLCQTCIDAPFSDHLQSFSESRNYQESPPASSTGSSRSVRSLSSGSILSHASAEGGPDEEAFTLPAFLRTPCECASRGVYLCQPCGQNLSATNTTYKRVWTWRSRYSTHIGGGLGTGLGQGEQGQKCGRGNQCLEKGAAGVCWVEIECSEARSMDGLRNDYSGARRGSTPIVSEFEPESTRNKPGYFSQEMEGIGGVVRKKVKKRIKVGATVYEFADERESGRYLERESSGSTRSTTAIGL